MVKMRVRIIAFIIAAFAIAALPQHAQATMYTYVDEDGVAVGFALVEV